MAQGYYYERITMQRKLTIYYTSDVHGYFSPVDYASGKSAQSGLANCMNGFANDGNTLIIDGGDILQGSPLTYYLYSQRRDGDCVPARLLNLGGYDFVTLGNHDFNYGKAEIERYLRELDAVCLCANIGGIAGVRRIAVVTLQNGLRVGLTGVTTHFVSQWEQPANLDGITVTDAFTAAAEAYAELQQQQVDLTVCIYHGGFENDLRTGAQPAVMARLLAAKTDVVTIIGTGLQGYMSLLCMSKVLDMKEIRVCDISEAAMDRFIARFPDAPFRFVKCKSNEEGCRGSDVIITVTNANADLVEEPWVKPGALVMTMGSFRETSFDVVRKADRIAVDQVGQSLHRGNVKELAEMGEITADSFDIIVPDVLAGKMPGRTDPNHRIYAQIIGTGMLDVALAGVLLEKLHAAGAQPPVFDMMGE